MRILVADDDPVYRSMLQELLTGWHFEVILASDGQEALEVMDSEDPPQLVFLDWEMPRVDGFEVARAIRSGDTGQRAYVLMITGSKQKEDIMQVLVCGADDYLIKPFDPIDLKIHLRSAMRILHLQEELDELRKAITEGAPRKIVWGTRY
ncbi:MAG: response regulator transcription factor [Phycisphaerae bacterium]|jgi:DNA-binding response OmpR family regulator|nr:response regulator transcription factor [Phycisphaerae bacterium]